MLGVLYYGDALSPLLPKHGSFFSVSLEVPFELTNMLRVKNLSEFKWIVFLAAERGQVCMTDALKKGNSMIFRDALKPGKMSLSYGSIKIHSM